MEEQSARQKRRQTIALMMQQMGYENDGFMREKQRNLCLTIFVLSSELSRMTGGSGKTTTAGGSESVDDEPQSSGESGGVHADEDATASVTPLAEKRSCVSSSSSVIPTSGLKRPRTNRSVGAAVSGMVDMRRNFLSMFGV